MELKVLVEDVLAGGKELADMKLVVLLGTSRDVISHISPAVSRCCCTPRLLRHITQQQAFLVVRIAEALAGGS